MATKTTANGAVTATSTKNGGVGKNVSGSSVLSDSTEAHLAHLIVVEYLLQHYRRW